MRRSLSPQADFGDLIETLVAVGIIGLLMAVAVGGVQSALSRVRLTESLWFSTSTRGAAHEQHALTGRWPAVDQTFPSGVRAATADSPIGTYVRDVRSGNEGSVHFTLESSATGHRGDRLSMRVAQTAYELSPVIVVCGYAKAPPPFEARGVNETNVAQDALPAPCRSRAGLTQ